MDQGIKKTISHKINTTNKVNKKLAALGDFYRSKSPRRAPREGGSRRPAFKKPEKIEKKKQERIKESRNQRI